MKGFFTTLSGSRAIRYSLGFLVLLVVADGIITNILISRGLARESNPFLWEIAGRPYLVIIKTAGALVCAVILWDIYRHWRRLGIASIYLFLVVYLLIVIWNISIFFM